jgi:zinc protease
MKFLDTIALKCTLIAGLILSNMTIYAQIEPTASVEGITEYRLKNGLKVLLFPDNSSQSITVNITYRVGSKHEGAGEKGMAHLLEHMVFKGTPNHPDIPKELTAHGTRPNGSTYYDRTNYYETFSATDENLKWALDLEADRMLNSFIAKKDLDSEFSVVRNEFESGENDPETVLRSKVINTAFLWHNYGNATIGNRSDIERVPIEKLQAFYKKYYRPDNAVLMVTGKIDVEKTLALIVERFEALKNPEVAIKDIPTVEPPQEGERRVLLQRIGNLQIVQGLYHIPAGSHEDYAAMSVAEQILTNKPSGRLYKALVDGKKAAQVYSYAPFTKEPSFLLINVNVPSDKSLEEAETTMLTLLDGLKDNPVTDEEVKRAKANLLKYYDEINRNSSYLGRYMSEFIGAGDWRLSFIHRDRIEQMTVAKVNAAITRYLLPTNRTVGVFKPTVQPPKKAIVAHTENLEELVAAYKGKAGYDAGEVFDVSYSNIQNTLETGRLDGIPVDYGFIKKNNRGKTITLNWVIRNGTANDFMHKGTVAGYTARLLDKGTTSKTRTDLKDALSAIKSSVNFSGTSGRITVSITTTEPHLNAALALMEDMLKHPKFSAEELEKLKTEDLAYLEQNKTQPQFLATKRLGILNQNYEKGHPFYVGTLEEDIEAIKAVSIAEVSAYYDTFYGISDSATLVAIGNINTEGLKRYFETSFKAFRVNKPYTAFTKIYKTNTSVNQSIITPEKKNAITIGILPFKSDIESKDYAALQIAGAIFGGGFLNSRITERLRQKEGLSYGAGGNIRVSKDPKNPSSSILVYAIYAPDNLAKIELGFKEEIARFIKDGITKEELDIAVKGWVQSEGLSRAKDNELARTINNNLYYGRDMLFHKAIETQIKTLTVRSVNKAIKTYFKPFNAWTVVNAGDFDN